MDAILANGEYIITLAAIIGAIIAIYKYMKKMITWIDNQEKQDAKIKSMSDEMTLLVYGVLACLRGLSEQGCDGPVHDAIDKIEKHLNVKAHE